jgi:hypothetical protein
MQEDIVGGHDCLVKIRGIVSGCSHCRHPGGCSGHRIFKEDFTMSKLASGRRLNRAGCYTLALPLVKGGRRRNLPSVLQAIV